MFGQPSRKTGGTLHFWLLAVLAPIALSHSAAAAPAKEVRRILILNEVNSTYPGIRIINQGIQAGLNDSPYHLDFYSEYMDTSLFPDPAVQQEFRDFYLRKYRNRKLDLIITVGPSPLKFMQEVHKKAFPGVPIVFCLPTLGLPGTPTLDPDFTGVGNDMAPAETVGIALRLLPGTKNIVVVGGVSPIDREQLANIKEELKEYEGRINISYLTDFAMPDLLERLKHLPSNTVVLLTSVGADAAGNSFKSNELGPMVAGAANAPVFSLFDVYLNHGEVGGDLSSLSEQGAFAGGMALRILRGEKPEDVARVRGANTYMFDWRALKRWGLNERQLPPGSIVINRQSTVWEAYKHYIIPCVALMFAETVLIFALLWQRKRRKESELHLRDSEERLRLAAQIGRMFAYSWDAATDLIQRSGESAEILGVQKQEWATGAKVSAMVHPDDKKRLEVALAKLSLDNPVLHITYRILRHDGAVIWLERNSLAYFDANGKVKRMVGMVVDVTERNRAKEALADMARKLIEAQEQERRRIGRELHDDVTQRLALWAVELEQLEHNPSELQSRVGKLRKEITETLGDVEALSHELHSAKLEYLGAVAGIKSWCREFGERQNIEIDFESEVAATALPSEIGVCLFRVLQEALHNAVKHSGVKRIEVRLMHQSNQVYLIVSDSGDGFNVESAKQGKGLGLTSMEERVRLVNGSIVIESKPMGGTTIHVRVPLGMETFSERIAS